MKNPQAEKLKPPYGQSSWYETFFDLNQRQKIEKVDLGFIRLNIVSSKHEYKIFSGLRFLGLIKEDGNATDKLASLRLVGDDFKKNMSETIKQAYHDLFSTIIVEKAKPENLINYFVQKHEMGSSIAGEAAKVFIFFTKKAEIPISQELLAMEIEKSPKTVERVRRKMKTATEVEKVAGPSEGIVELRYEDIRMWLPKNDTEAVKRAIRFLEFHLKELESNKK